MNNIENLRKGRNLTRPQLGEQVGVKGSTIYQWEREIRYPELRTAFRLADFFEVSTDYLFGRTSA